MFLKKLFADKDLKAFYGVLDELSYSHDTQAFEIIKTLINNEKPENIRENINKETSPRVLVHYLIRENICSQIISGNYHLTRGVLNPLGPGKDFLVLFDYAVNVLVENNFLSKEEGKGDFFFIRQCVRDSG